MTQWWALQLHSGEDRRAMRHLAEQGLETWLPTIELRTMRRGLPVARDVLVCPGYGFVLAQGTPWSVNSTPGVLGLLPNPARPLAVPADAIAVMREHIRAGEEALRPRLTTDGFAEDDELRITDGAFAGFPATVAVVEKHMLRVIAHLFGRPTAVTVRPDQVELTLRPPEVGRSAKGHQQRRAERAEASR